MSTLSVRNVNKRFGGLKALDNVNLEVEAGTVHAIIGPNGAGKSTLLNCFIGRLEPDSGSVTFDGQSLLGMAPHEINQAGVSRVFQTPEIFGDLSLIDNVMIPSFARRDGAFKINAWAAIRRNGPMAEKAMSMLCDVGLDAKADETAAHLSRGDKRRLELAMCLVQRPKLLLLDEPTAGVSGDEKFPLMDRLTDVLRKQEVTTVFVEHDMDLVRRYADRVAVWSQGKVAASGPPEQVLTDPAVLRDVVGVI